MKSPAAFCVLALLFTGGSAVAQSAAHPPATIVWDASDFITIVKWTFIFLGFLLAVIAALGVTFFGFDVRNARATIDKEISELRKVIEEAKALRAELKETSARQRETQIDLEEIGAKVEEVAAQPPAAALSGAPTRTLPDLIREALRNSRFEWTTIGTLQKRTSLTRDQILAETRAMNDIRIGNGKKSHDVIFRFKRADEQ